MGFFARPDLSDIQFKQLSGSTLTLSGQTRIAAIGNLSFQSGNTYIPIVITGGTNYDVLTLVSGQLRLQKPSSGASTGYYTCRTPSTVCVGGIPIGEKLTGRTIANILQEMLAPLVNPTILSPSISFSIILSNPYEVGTPVTPTGVTSFDRGLVSPAYCGGSVYRSGLPTKYCYLNFDGIYTGFTSASLSYSHALAQYVVQPGVRCAYSYVTYSSGCTPVYNSSGGTYLPALSAGTICSFPVIIDGIYPYFYGKITCACPAGVGRPSSICIKSIITGGTGICTKCVLDSNNSICINFNSGSCDYYWFAIPSGSTLKTSWCLSLLNCGSIGGVVSAGGNLFPAYNSITCVTSASLGGCPIWTSPKTYLLYISNYQNAASTLMQIS